MSNTTKSSAKTTQINETDKRHREYLRDFALTKALDSDRITVANLYESWERFNKDFFDGALTVPCIMLTTPSNPRRFGDCGPEPEHGGTLIRIRRSLLDGSHPRVQADDGFAFGRYLLVEDILLHETVHQYHQEITGEKQTGEHGHGAAFRDECNRIGKILGLREVVTQREVRKAINESDGMAGGDSCTYWPYGVRPPLYYGGAYIFERPARRAACALCHNQDPEAAAIHWDNVKFICTGCWGKLSQLVAATEERRSA
jgi:hypothetical protein